MVDHLLVVDQPPEPGWRCLAGRLRLDDLSVPVVLYRMPAPASYTREDVAELHLPGADPLVERVLDALTTLGARPAGPGEFTRRALEHGRIDLVQAEAVMKLIRAEDDRHRQAALSELGGRLSAQVETIRRSLLAAKVRVEGAIDFFEDDEALDDLQHAGCAVDDALHQLEPMVDHDAADFHAGRPSVVLVGRPNAGKSSLFNHLSSDHRAVVTDRPGTTRDYLEGTLVTGEVTARLFDTAGRLEPADDPVTTDSMRHLEHLLGGADVVVLVLDATRVDATESVRPAELPAGAWPHLVVLNKVDLLPAPDPMPVPVGAAPESIVPCSAQTGQGLDDLRRRLGRLLAHHTGVGRSELNLRQSTLVRRAVDHLRRARQLLHEGNLLELVSIELDEAADGLSGLGRRIVADDVLDDIFADFCIGK